MDGRAHFSTSLTSVTAPRLALDTNLAYFASTPLAYFGGGARHALRRRWSSSPDTLSWSTRRSASMLIESLSCSSAMVPPTAPSGGAQISRWPPHTAGCCCTLTVMSAGSYMSPSELKTLKRVEGHASCCMTNAEDDAWQRRGVRLGSSSPHDAIPTFSGAVHGGRSSDPRSRSVR
jgi:hypothetical protein